MERVFIPIPISTIEEEQELPSLTYRLDLDAGRIVGKIDGQEAVRQAIRKALITPRFKCLIYDHQYGCELEDVIISKSASQGYIRASAEGFTRDALKPDTRILDISDFKIDLIDDGAQISFTATTIFGETEITEVI